MSQEIKRAELKAKIDIKKQKAVLAAEKGELMKEMDASHNEQGLESSELSAVISNQIFWLNGSFIALILIGAMTMLIIRQL